MNILGVFLIIVVIFLYYLLRKVGNQMVREWFDTIKPGDIYELKNDPKNPFKEPDEVLTILEKRGDYIKCNLFKKGENITVSYSIDEFYDIKTRINLYKKSTN